MRPIILLPLLAVLPAGPLLAATHTVLPDTSIQAKIDLAQPGDVVAILGGTYPEDITVNKAVRLVEADGHEVVLTGNVTFENVLNAPPFEGFSLTAPGKGIQVNGTTSIIIRNITATAGFGLRSAGGATVAVISGSYSNIFQDGGQTTLNGTTVTETFETSANSTKTVAFRANVAGQYLWRSKKAWCGYSKGRHFKHHGSNSTIIVLGCEFDGLNYLRVGSEQHSNSFNSGYFENYAIDIRGSGNHILVANNDMHSYVYGNVRHSNQPYPFIHTIGRGVSIEGDQASITVVNNYIGMALYAMHNGTVDTYGILAQTPKSYIFNNIIEGSYVAISAPLGAAVAQNCLNVVHSIQHHGGHVPIDTLNSDPLYVPNNRRQLQASSPCLNAGSPNPIFNDLDGTRNNIGPSGGCLFDPDGWTTDKPVVISFDLAPVELLKGTDTEVTLSNGQAVGQQ